ncbi:MAG: hypothetical protein ACKO45_07040 [Cyanobium sp.]
MHPARARALQGTCGTYERQQQRDQIRRALKEAIEPVVRFQGPPPDIASTATARQADSTRVLKLLASAFPRRSGDSSASGL